MTDLDRKMISKLNEELSKNFFKELLSRGLLKPSGKNCISLMTTSGAKGASVSSYCSHNTVSYFYIKLLVEVLTGKAMICWLQLLKFDMEIE